MSFGKRKIPKHLIIEEYQHKKTHGFGWLLLAASILLLSMFISLYASASSDLYESDLYDSKSGQLLFKNVVNKYQPSLHISSKANVDINGLISHVTVSQSFINHTDQWQEGVYVFPLPENAAVNHMEMTIGERVIVGEIKEKTLAKKIYQEAKRTGKRATLSEQLRPNLFSHRVANIGPQQKVDIRITYVHTNQYDKGEFSWRFPMTITPRYFPKSYLEDPNIISKNNPDHEEVDRSHIHISNQNGWATEESQSLDSWPLPSSVNTFDTVVTGVIKNPIELHISLNGGLPLSHINALFHDVIINKAAQKHSIRLAKNNVNMDRDFVLTWRPIESQSPQAALFTEELDDEYYSLLMVIPPLKDANKHTLTRDIVFILDVSGSMQGSSINQAKESLKQALSQLSPNDRFNIIAFNSHYKNFTQKLEPASNSNLNAAKYWINQLHANGGTEMLPALGAAFKQFGQSQSLQQTIFITDGAVGNESILFKKIMANLGSSRLFTVGIGSAPNSYFMKKAAEFGRGTFTYIGDNQHISQKIQDLFTKLDSAIAKDIRVNWPGAESHIYPNKIPDLYSSEPLLVSAKSESLRGDVLIEGITALAPWQRFIPLENRSQGKGISTIWARAKIEELEDLKISGGNHEILQQEITDIALSHRLLSAYTSFIAVEKAPASPLDKTVQTSAIQNAIPNGYLPITYPASATNAEMTWWFGLFCMVLAIIIRRLLKD